MTATRQLSPGVLTEVLAATSEHLRSFWDGANVAATGAADVASPEERYFGSMALLENEIPVDEGVIRDLLSTQRPDLAKLSIGHVGGGTDNTMYRIGPDLLARFPRTSDKVGALEKELTWLPRLRPHLTHPIPTPVHVGHPGPHYPLPWALYTWIQGQEVSAATVTDWYRYGTELAEFVSSLHATDLMGAARSGDLSWYRGGTLRPHDGWVGPCFDAARRHGTGLDFERLEKLWREALELPEPDGPDVWLHADLKPTNVLAREGRLHAVIDFGALSVGHPDAEHATTWDLPATAREAYRDALNIDDLTWARARAWALAIGMNGVAEYWISFPSFATECVRRLAEIAVHVD